MFRLIKEIFAMAPKSLLFWWVAIFLSGAAVWTGTVTDPLWLALGIFGLVNCAAFGIIRHFRYKSLEEMVASQRELIAALKQKLGAHEEADSAAVVRSIFNGMGGNRRADMSEDAKKAVFQAVDKVDVSLDDVRGMPETVKDIMEVVKILSHMDDLESIGGTAPSGLLLTGAPGTGKTLIAKAIAGTCKMRFIPVSSSAFVDKYVGEGASRVRMVFDEARKLTEKGEKVIIFFDEIDALCAKRGESSNGERDQTLNQLLCELDGFANRKGIFVIAATNRDDMLDEAITRPGRLDRTINVPMPDKAGRRDILRFYLKKYRYTEAVDVEAIVNKTVGFSPAELRNLLNTAAISAVCDDKKAITPEYIDEAYFKIIMKGNKRDSERTEQEDRLVAYHEAGHAVVHTLLGGDEVTEVTIIGSTAGTGGVTMIAPKERIVRTIQEIRTEIKALYGGRAAEEVLMGDSKLITTGASSDIHVASQHILRYLEKWGMNSSGMLDYGVFRKDGESLEDAQKLSQELYNETLQFMQENSDVLAALAEELLAKRSLEGNEVRAIIKKALEARATNVAMA